MLSFNPPPNADFQQMVQSLADADAERTASKGPAAPRYELKAISHVHEAVLNWMIAHPDKKLSQCAEHFGYTQSWLSTMIHSDLFQAALKEKQDKVFSGLAGTINEKLMAGADIGVTKLVEKLETSEDPKFIKETTTMMLEKLGFGAQTRVAGALPAGTQNVQNNFYMASQADLQQARGRIAQTAVLPASEPAALPAPLPTPDSAAEGSL